MLQQFNGCQAYVFLPQLLLKISFLELRIDKRRTFRTEFTEWNKYNIDFETQDSKQKIRILQIEIYRFSSKILSFANFTNIHFVSHSYFLKRDRFIEVSKNFFYFFNFKTSCILLPHADLASGKSDSV